VAHVVGDDTVRASCNRKFENELIARIGKERSQPEVNIGLAPKIAESPDDGIHHVLGNVQARGLPLPHCFVFEDQRDGNQSRPVLTKATKDGKGRSPAGAHSRHDDVRI